MNKKITAAVLLAGITLLSVIPLKAEAASVWSFCDGKKAIENNGQISMTYQEYKNFDLMKGEIVITEKADKVDDYTVVWKSSDEDAVWINKRTGQARANKFDQLNEDSATVKISAVITNTKTEKQIVRSFKVNVDNTEFTKKNELPTPSSEVIVTPEATPTPSIAPEPTTVPTEPDNDNSFRYVRGDVKKLVVGSAWKTNLDVLMDTIDFYYDNKLLTKNDIIGIESADYTEIGTPVTKTYIRSISVKVYIKSINPMWDNPQQYIVNKVPINYPFDVEE